MNRQKAIYVISKHKVATIDREVRASILLNWWGIDNENPELKNLPENLQKELNTFDEPVADIMDERYAPLLIEAIKNEFIGVKNDYISQLISEILFDKIEVVGQEETLYECPCCRYQTIKERGQYEICPICFWEDDGSDELARYSSVNHMILSEGKDYFCKNGCETHKSMDLVNTDIKNRYHMGRRS